MVFEWDENKNKINIAKHNIDFIDATYVLEQGDVHRIISARATRRKERKDYEEAKGKNR